MIKRSNDFYPTITIIIFMLFNFYIGSTALRPYKSESTFSYTLSIGCIPYYVQIHLVIKYKTEPTDASEDD